MARSSTSTSARARAREAHARQLEARRTTDRQVEQATVDYYEAYDLAEEARRTLAEAELAQAASVARLGDLGQSVAEVAALCSLTDKEVRALRKAHEAELALQELLPDGTPQADLLDEPDLPDPYQRP